jgi:heme-degrading monooxygenase HmoA
MSVLVVITATIKPEDLDDFERAYLDVTRKVHDAAGHTSDTLLSDTSNPTRYCLIAEWESEEVFRAWADDPRHIGQSAAMFPYWEKTFERRIYQVRATLAQAVATAAEAETTP